MFFFFFWWGVGFNIITDVKFTENCDREKWIRKVKGKRHEPRERML